VNEIIIYGLYLRPSDNFNLFESNYIFMGLIQHMILQMYN